MKYLLFTLATIIAASACAQNDPGFYQPVNGVIFHQPVKYEIIDVSAYRQNDCESDTTVGAWKSDTTVGAWKSDDLWAQACSHEWVYAEKDDVNEIRFTIASDDDYCPCGCPYDWKEGRICRVCLRSEIRAISVKNQERQSEYQKLIKRKKDRQ